MPHDAVLSSEDDSVVWSEELLDSFASAVKSCLTVTAKKELDRRARSGRETKENEVHTCNHHHCGHKSFHFKRNEGDFLGETLDFLTQDEQIENNIVEIAERAAKVYFNVLKSSAEDGVTLTDEEHAKYLRTNILKEAVLRHILNALKNELVNLNKQDSLEGGFLANPSAVQFPLDLIPPEAMGQLMKQGYGIIDGVLADRTTDIFNECQFLEYDGQFNENGSGGGEGSQFFAYWCSPKHFDRENFKNLHRLFELMLRLPYELNKKANLLLQMSQTFYLTHFPANNSVLSKCIDGGFKKDVDNGRKITCVYFPNSTDWKGEDGGLLRLYVDGLEINKEGFVDICPKGGRLVLFRSRNIPYEVTICKKKRFAITLWLNGPPSIKEDV